MVTKKDLIIAVLVTFCLTVTIFMIMPIKSANNAYDPMLDYYHTGTIGLPDLVKLANSYGTTGDPTMPVNVTNWDQGYSVEAANNPTNLSTLEDFGPFYVGGYSHFVILINAYSGPALYNPIENITLSTISWRLANESRPAFLDNPNIVVWNANITNFQIPTFETKAPYLTFELSLTPFGSLIWIYFDLYLYLRND